MVEATRQRTPPEIRRQSSEVLRRIERTINHLTPLGEELLNAHTRSRDDSKKQALTQQYHELQEKLQSMHSEAAKYKSMLEHNDLVGEEESGAISQRTPKPLASASPSHDETPKRTVPDDVGDTSPRESSPRETGPNDVPQPIQPSHVDALEPAFPSSFDASSSAAPLEPPNATRPPRPLPRSPSLPVNPARVGPMALRNAKVVGRVRQLSELLAQSQRTCQKQQAELASKDADLQEARADQKIAEAYASTMTANEAIAAAARKDAEDAREELEKQLDEMKAMRDDARQRAQQAETREQAACVPRDSSREVRAARGSKARARYPRHALSTRHVPFHTLRGLSMCSRSERRHASELLAERNEHLRERKALRDELQASRDEALELAERERAAVEAAAR